MIDPRVVRVRAVGVLAEYKLDFAKCLEGLGYAPLSALNQVRLMAYLSQWLDAEGIELEQLDEFRVEQFLSFRRDQEHSAWIAPGSLRVILKFLGSVGLVSAAVSPVPVTSAEKLVAEYTTYLATERGLVQATIKQRRSLAELFLEELGSDSAGLHQLSGQQVVDFVQVHVGDHGVGTAKLLVSNLRCFLRFLYLTGKTQQLLADVVPGVADSRRRQLPKHVAPELVEQLIDSCSSVSVVGLRDRAVLLLLARLGLRAGEIVGLLLEDLDWQAGQIRMYNGKGQRHDVLPLPADVGAAIAVYLQHGRPAVADRRVFISVIAPLLGLSNGAIGQIVKVACQRAGVQPVGSHQIRHTLATKMLNTGASLFEVSQLLRHADLSTTSIYAKVDYSRLALAAAVWPGGAQ